MKLTLILHFNKGDPEPYRSHPGSNSIIIVIFYKYATSLRSIRTFIEFFHKP